MTPISTIVAAILAVIALAFTIWRLWPFISASIDKLVGDMIALPEDDEWCR